MRQKRKALAAAVALAATAAFVPHVRAITDEEIFRQLRFNFINPGGRALGLGGTFIALADDATAAQANPAGLMQLAAPEFFLEERYLGGDKTTSSQSGQFGFNLTSTNERRATTTPTFFSYVIPFHQVAFGLSRQEVLNTRVETLSSFTFATGALGGAGWEGTGEAAVQVTNWNLAVAWRPVTWISFGVTGSLGQLHIDSRVENRIFDPQGVFLCEPGGPIDCDEDNNGFRDNDNNNDGTNEDVIDGTQNPLSWYSTSIDDQDTEFGFSAGVLWLPNDKFSVGAVYRSDTEYEFQQEFRDGLSDATFGGGVTPYNPSVLITTETMHLPSSYGLGFKWRPTPNWTFVADGVRVNYTDLLEDLTSDRNILTNLIRFPDKEYAYDDVTEVHVGAEYLFTGGAYPWALRAGAYLDPDNVLRSENQQSVQFFGDSLDGRDDEIHYTAGFGIVIQEKFQADVGASVSSIGTEAVVSLIYRF